MSRGRRLVDESRLSASSLWPRCKLWIWVIFKTLFELKRREKDGRRVHGHGQLARTKPWWRAHPAHEPRPLSCSEAAQRTPRVWPSLVQEGTRYISHKICMLLDMCRSPVARTSRRIMGTPYSARSSFLPTIQTPFRRFWPLESDPPLDQSPYLLREVAPEHLRDMRNRDRFLPRTVASAAIL